MELAAKRFERCEFAALMRARGKGKGKDSDGSPPDIPLPTPFVDVKPISGILSCLELDTIRDSYDDVFTKVRKACTSLKNHKVPDLAPGDCMGSELLRTKINWSAFQSNSLNNQVGPLLLAMFLEHGALEEY